MVLYTAVNMTMILCRYGNSVIGESLLADDVRILKKIHPEKSVT